MRSKSSTGKGMFASKAINVTLSVVLVLGLSPATKAVAAGGASQAAEPAAQQDAPSDAQAISGDQASAGTASASVADAGDGADGNAGLSADAAAPAASNAAASESAGQVESPAASASPASIMPAAAGEYQEHAEYREVTTGISVAVCTDPELKNPVGSDPVAGDATLYGKANIDFAFAEQPTLSSPNVKYTFPSNVSFSNKSEQTLYDVNNQVAGSWRIENGVAYLHYNEDWLSKDHSNIQAHFAFDFTMNAGETGDGKSVTVNFPGTANLVVINTKDGNVTGEKYGANPKNNWEMPTLDLSDNSYTWTIKVSPATTATDLKIEDAIGANLDFVPGSFKLVDENGAQISGKCDTTIDGQKATISLGTLSKGSYYVQYKTTVKQSALDALKNGEELSGVENSAQWKWGAEGNHVSDTVKKTPAAAKYSMVSKSAADESTNDNISWVVKLNTGSLKADVSGYTFTDTLDGNQQFKSGTNYVVTNASGEQIATGLVDPSSSELKFTLPDGLGKQELTVTYATTMKDTSSTKKVQNTSQVTPPNGKGISGEASAEYLPKDDRTYITKTLEKADTVEKDGKASWESVVNFKAMDADTDPSTVVFFDEISNKTIWEQIKISDVKLSVVDSETLLTEGTDYVVNENGERNRLQITFKDSETVKGLVGKGNVSIKYVTTSKTDNATYTNKSSVKIGGVYKGSAKASYIIDKKVVPAVSKKASDNVQWNAGYEWPDGSKGAWIVDWEVHVNCNEPNSWTHSAASDLKGAEVAVKDALGDGLTYVPGSSQYWLYGDNGYSTAGYSPELKAEPSFDGGTATFAIPTARVADEDGSWKGYVKLTYKTAIKASAVEPGESKEFSNTAEASAGDLKFPAGTGKATVANKVLDKQAAYASDGAHVAYTIKVNPNALKIGSSDSLTLVDTLSAGAAFTNRTLSVTDAEGKKVTEGVSYTLKNKANEDGSTSTVLTLTVPNSKALTVSYDVAPQGAVGSQVQIGNVVEMQGFSAASARHAQKWGVNESHAGTSATSYGLSIVKTDETGVKALQGAEFTLYKVDLSASAKGNVKKTKVGSVGDNPKATDTNGIVKFGDKEHPLDANTLYCYEETKAPAGYKISNPDPTYVMFSGTSDQDKADYAAELAKAEALGIHPNAGTTFTVFDEKESAPASRPASATFVAQKVLEGADLAEGQFSFQLKGKDGSVLQTKSNAADGKVAFDAVSYDAAGTYEYTLSEVKGSAAGVSYDETVHDVKVAVTDDGHGALQATVTYDGKPDTPVFTNTYVQVQSAKTELKVKKTVVGGTEAVAGEWFEFELKDADGKVLSTASAQAGGTASFAGIAYTAADAGKTFEYTVHEVGHNSEGWFAADDVTAIVKVSDNGDGTLKAEVSYSNGVNAAEFDDVKSSAVGKIELFKTVNGGPIREGERFTFALLDEQGKQVGKEIAADDKAPIASFDELAFDAPGEYSYTIHETSELGDGWTNDADVAVTVKVVRDEAAKALKVESVDYGGRAYEQDGAKMAHFDNKFEEPKKDEGTKEDEKPKKDKETKDDTPQQPTGGETNGNGKADGKTSGLTQTSDSAGAAMTLAAGVAATAPVTAASAKLASRRRKESGR